MKQIDRIRNMNVEELAKTIKAVAIKHLCDKMLCGDGGFDIEAWLESEVENE